MHRHLSQQRALNDPLLCGVPQQFYRRLLTGSLTLKPLKFFNELAVRKIFAIDEKRHNSPECNESLRKILRRCLKVSSIPSEAEAAMPLRHMRRDQSPAPSKQNYSELP